MFSLDIVLKVYSKVINYNLETWNFGFLYFWNLLMSQAISYWEFLDPLSLQKVQGSRDEVKGLMMSSWRKPRSRSVGFPHGALSQL